MLGIARLDSRLSEIRSPWKPPRNPRLASLKPRGLSVETAHGERNNEEFRALATLRDALLREVEDSSRRAKYHDFTLIVERLEC